MKLNVNKLYVEIENCIVIIRTSQKRFYYNIVLKM